MGFKDIKIKNKMAVFAVVVILFNGISKIGLNIITTSHNQNTVIVELAGKNRMLSQKIIALTAISQSSNSNTAKQAHIQLKKAVSQLQKNILLLKNGGYYRSQKLEKATQVASKKIKEIEQIVKTEKKLIATITNSKTSELTIKKAEDELNQLYLEGKLLDRADELVTIYVNQDEQKEDQFSWVILFSFFANSIVVLIVLYSTRITVVNPINQLTTSFKEMLKGNKEINIKLDRKDEIGIMSQQLDGVLEKMIEAEELALEAKKTQGMFLANMSHEIRTPMNSIVGFTNLLSNTTLNIKQKQFLSNIKTNANNLLVIINDILDFSKVEAGKISLEHIVFSLKETTNQVIIACEEKAALNNATITFEFDTTLTEWVIGDPTRLYQILLNIVSNAVKFTKDGEILVRIEKLNDLSDYNAIIRFSVKDTGIGMTQEVASKMFESFTQASDSITRKFGGTGLGLSIVKHLVELHKGTIEVTSEPGLGTTFVIDIPYPCTTAPEQSNEFDQTISQEILEEFKEKNYRILLADDVEFNRTVAIETIQEWGLNIDVLEAENGIQALEIFEKESIDLILMDIEMPEMNGYTATQKIRTELPETKRNIPIIAMSAHASHTNIQTSLSMGMNDYITKPFHHQDLFTKIIKHLVATEKETLPILELKETIREVEETKANTQVVDVPFILEFTKGKQDRIAKMVNLFLQSTPEELNRLQHLYKEQNYKEVGTLVHSFKAKFTYMGMQQLTEIAKEIEHNAKEEKNLEHAGTLIQELVISCDVAYEELKKLVN